MPIEPGRQSIGDGDNWPITWAENGILHTVYCDGSGFGGGSGQASMSLAKIAGTPQWSSRFEERKPVFSSPGHCYRSEVVRHHGLKRYLLSRVAVGARPWQRHRP